MVYFVFYTGSDAEQLAWRLKHVWNPIHHPDIEPFHGPNWGYHGLVLTHKFAPLCYVSPVHIYHLLSHVFHTQDHACCSKCKHKASAFQNQIICPEIQVPALYAWMLTEIHRALSSSTEYNRTLFQETPLSQVWRKEKSVYLMWE